MQHRDAVAIGGSTGAIEAMKQLCRALPRGFPAAVFVVIHVGAEGRDLLAGIFDCAGALRASTALDDQPVEPGRIYVAPADRHLLVIDGVIRLGRGPRENMTRPAVDPLFRSVAASYGARAVGVVLSGRLNDGAAGLADLKRSGAVTIVQNPTDASAPDMPMGALQASDVDYRASVSDIGDLLVKLTSEAPGPSVEIPPSVALEVDIALGRPCLTETIEQLADPAPLSCPACSGVLSQIRQAPPLRFRCQVGHGYTAEALASEQEGGLDEAMRVALRIIEERAVLSERMAKEATAAGRTRTAATYAERAREFRTYADTIRRAATGCDA